MGLRVIWMNTAYIIVNVFVLSVRGHGLENKSAFPKTENFKITEIQFMIAVNATWQGEQCVYIFIFMFLTQFNCVSPFLEPCPTRVINRYNKALQPCFRRPMERIMMIF